MEEEIRQQIVEAAKRRFAHYGYSKSSMSEIAQDCEMSVGNLYRFFKNKEAIAVAGTHSCLLEKAESSEISAQQESSAPNKLYEYLLARLRYMHQFVSETPHMHELVELMSTRHQAVLQSYEDRAITFMATLVRQGQEEGSLKSGDADRLAADIYRATICFNMPHCMYGALAEKEVQLKLLFETLLQGLVEKGEDR